MSDDFEYQLEQEMKERETKNGETKSGETKIYDGTEYEWNESMKAWVPKIDLNFIAEYQSNYGNFTTDEECGQQSNKCQDNSTSTITQESVPTTNTSNDNKANNKKQFVSKLLNKPKAEEVAKEWFDVSDEHNTKVYVSNLPSDTSEEEFFELMKKCGLIEKDERNEYKIKLYRDSNGQLKGDGLCTYLKVESIQLALDILDGYQFKDKRISVERAKFSLKGQFDPSLKPKRKKKDKQKERKKVQKLLDWRPEKVVVERPKCEKTVIIKNMFDPKEFLREPKLILEYRSDLRDECNERCGQVKRVDIYDCHPEGVASITLVEFEGADQCVQLMNGRFFAGRRLSAHHWDGRTKYKIDETEEEAEERIKQWDEFLEKEDN